MGWCYSEGRIAVGDGWIVVIVMEGLLWVMDGLLVMDMDCCG